MSSKNQDRTRSNQQAPTHEGREPNTLIIEDQSLRLGFIQLPKLILYARNLSRDAKLLYAILLGYAWQEKSCFPGYSRLCKDMQLSENMVRKYMRELESIALIRQKRRGLGLTNIYVICDLRNAKLDVSEAEPQSTEVQEHKPSEVQKPQSTEDYEETSKDKQVKNTQTFRKGTALKNQKGTGGGESKKTYSHIAHTAIGNQKPKKNESPPNSGTLDAVLTTNTRPRRQGKGEAGLEQISVTLEHMDVLNRQYGSSPAEQNGNHKPAPGTPKRQGNWKKAPLFIQGTIGDWFSPEMHDQSINSTITRVNRIFQQWQTQHPELDYEQQQDAFYTMMQEARTKSKHAKIKKLTPTGQPNRTPFFLTCLADLSGLNQDS